jgi:hypothetical protein
MEDLIKEYNQRLNEYSNLNFGLDIPLSFKLFDIRLKLANSIDSMTHFEGYINFDNQYIRSSYTRMIKLMEIWYSYEALLKFTKPNEITKEVKYKVISNRILVNAGCEELFENFYRQLIEECKNVNFINDLNRLNLIIQQDSGLGKTVKTDCERLISSLNNQGERLSKLEIMALIYAERNMYIHNGLTPFGNMNHNNRLFLLDLYTQYLCQYIFKLAIYLLSLRIYERLNN